MNVPPTPTKIETLDVAFFKKKSRPCMLTPWRWHNSHRSYRLSNVAPGIHRSNDPRLFTWRCFLLEVFLLKNHHPQTKIGKQKHLGFRISELRTDKY